MTIGLSSVGAASSTSPLRGEVGSSCNELTGEGAERIIFEGSAPPHPNPLPNGERERSVH
jgi:hypothetical protein